MFRCLAQDVHQIRDGSVKLNVIEALPKGSKQLETQSKEEDDASCRLFASNLPHDVTQSTLEEYFSKFGTVVQVRIPGSHVSTSTPAASSTTDTTATTAPAAASEESKTEVKDDAATETSEANSSSSSSSASATTTTPATTTSTEPKIAFVTFSKPSELIACLAVVDHTINGVRITVTKARAKPGHENLEVTLPCRLFATKLPNDSNANEVKKFFAQFGIVIDVMFRAGMFD